MDNRLKQISRKEKQSLFEALNYMKMEEIKEFCQKHSIPFSGKKGAIIDNIKRYLTTGQIKTKVIPAISKKKIGKSYPVSPNAKIIKGAYKNDLNTRNFFKKIIGDHFHFTAFGQDWILERWQAGKPPTYSQFAKFWQKEYLRRKKSKAKPKKEWAYLNFLQRFSNKNHSKQGIAVAWEKERSKQVKEAMMVLNKIKVS